MLLLGSLALEVLAVMMVFRLVPVQGGVLLSVNPAVGVGNTSKSFETSSVHPF